MIWDYEFRDGKASWIKQQNYIGIVATKIMQELLLWATENPMSVLSGVNYKSVFDLEVFLRHEVQSIIEQYDEVDYHMIEQSIINNNILTLKITLSINSEIVTKELKIKNEG